MTPSREITNKWQLAVIPVNWESWLRCSLCFLIATFSKARIMLKFSWTMSIFILSCPSLIIHLLCNENYYPSKGFLLAFEFASVVGFHHPKSPVRRQLTRVWPVLLLLAGVRCWLVCSCNRGSSQPPGDELRVIFSALIALKSNFLMQAYRQATLPVGD